MQLAPPTNSYVKVASEKERWEATFAGVEYFYGHDPGPLARRVVKYHQAFSEQAGYALDAGCGEGQDLVFLAQNGYDATGIEFTTHGVEKTRKLLHATQQNANVEQGNLTDCPLEFYDVVLAVNCLQFLGEKADSALFRLMAAVKPNGFMGLSLFAREANQPEIAGTIWRISFADLLGRFADWQPIEAANLWQWNIQTNQPQAFVTLIARRTK